MSQPNLHPWTLNPDQAIELQVKLRDRLVLTWDEREVTTIGGVDVSYKEEQARAAIVVMGYPDLAPIESVTIKVPIIFSYIPGLLAFREGPAVLTAWKQLHTKPDLIIFDAQGIAHPRGIGLASHMGCGWNDQVLASPNQSFMDVMFFLVQSAVTAPNYGTNTIRPALSARSCGQGQASAQCMYRQDILLTLPTPSNSC